jgi:hypothetical protein
MNMIVFLMNEEFSSCDYATGDAGADIALDNAFATTTIMTKWSRCTIAPALTKQDMHCKK